MKLLTAQQTREWDQYTCTTQHITPLELMERAAGACARYIASWISEQEQPVSEIIVFCGPGNNGGDGLAIARLLAAEGWPVQVYVTGDPQKRSSAFEANYNRLRQETAVPVAEIDDAGLLPVIGPGALVIEALLGAGLNRPVTGLMAELIRHLNQSQGVTIAIDVPGGLPADLPAAGGLSDHLAVKARLTLTFQQFKTSFLFEEGHAFTGNVVVLDIGLSEEFIGRAGGDMIMITASTAQKITRPRSMFSHKGTFGHALIAAGSYGKTGAAVLACKAAMRTGCGLLTAYVPKSGYAIMQVSLPEAITITDESPDSLSAFPETAGFSAIGAGPGIGTTAHTRAAFKNWLGRVEQPLVLDADALNLFAGLLREGEARLPAGTIITPHPKEFDRLAGHSPGPVERFRKQRQFAAEHQVIVVLKGAYTSIALPGGEVYFNSTGNPLLATAGSGDVLTGIITSLLAQGYTPKEAALLGVYLHGACSDRIQQSGKATLLASEITDQIPAVLHTIASGTVSAIAR